DKMSDVEINIYSYQGQIIKSFKLDNLPAGNHQVIWNASDNSSKKVSNGIYFIKIKSENGTKTAKIILAN
ncbi:MAG: T9SS type A sorting domain-containing protein, partial [Bacteroidales bacterium]|nr:T9SS type A sorting domain-containing protein [Bacteroidales bacterium]